jgi:hypothetical protein
MIFLVLDLRVREIIKLNIITNIINISSEFIKNINLDIDIIKLNSYNRGINKKY